MTRSRIIPKLTVTTSSGSDPDVIEIDDCREVYGETDFPEIVETCPKAPAGQCEYSWRDHWHACIHCGRASGLDE